MEAKLCAWLESVDTPIDTPVYTHDSRQGTAGHSAPPRDSTHRCARPRLYLCSPGPAGPNGLSLGPGSAVFRVWKLVIYVATTGTDAQILDYDSVGGAAV